MKKSAVCRSGFTLVEVLVVAALVALLAAIALPVLSSAREKGRSATCQAHQKQILLAVAQYATDADSFLPRMYYHEGQQIVTWYEVLTPYTKNRQVFRCPTDPGSQIGGAWEPPPAFRSSFAASYDLLNGNGSIYASPASLTRVRKPTTTVFLADAGAQTTPEPPHVTESSEVRDGCWLIWLSLNSHSSNPDGAICGPSLRHRGRTNVGFVDGHVKSMAVEDWFYNGSGWTDWTGG